MELTIKQTSNDERTNEWWTMNDEQADDEQ
jgi:hypothetical protein